VVGQYLEDVHFLCDKACHAGNAGTRVSIVHSALTAGIDNGEALPVLESEVECMMHVDLCRTLSTRPTEHVTRSINPE
jgi:hypothetical protein